ncbi:2-dehydro-3-deoxygalactonokinase [Poseidonocella sedimentorum]|uniref:2-dehydro-3-deoxygalactonokinase n=1 Tax=Poseidonocella sedimentorum TaxID=871652 RepID=A0A1I6D681_9RHOB|nr:2-dehydro-3-deoxygalactonokinase [Poseidonocella sedimentorum]SFR00969.1 2-dehydro-3-deoxygalactonokinase [Poseidonocella sedimentorum]
MSGSVRNSAISWIAVDWGTTHLRAWAMDAAGEVLAEASSADGMGALTRDGFEPALVRLIDGWLSDGVRLPVIACGMVGSRQGWVEAPYRAVPCRAEAGAPVTVETRDSRLSVHVIPGVMQPEPPDVMRGEETQIAGFLAANEGWDGVVCLPGTHTKWAHLSAGEIVSFQTFMTGDLFAAIAGHTVLRHSVTTDSWDTEAFEEAVADAISRPEKLAARLFGLRAAGLLHGRDGASATAALSGYLIGAELAAARPYWLGQQVAVIGASKVAAHYAAALANQGVSANILSAQEAVLRGLAAHLDQVKATT